MKSPQTILIVDDETTLRSNLRTFLEDLDYQVVEAAGGREALEASRSRPPDLVLLDIRMPGLDGFEVCRALKEAPGTADVPVLFLSALMGTADKLEAFACGGVDYLTKPFQLEEVEARVKAHLELHRQRRTLKEQHEALSHLERLRDNFTHMVAHDMRSPLTAIMASLELSLILLPPENAAISGKLSLALTSAAILNDMIDQMLDLSRMESRAMPLEPRLCDVARLAELVLELMGPGAGRRKLAVQATGPVLAWCDPAIIHRVLSNLLGNGLKFTDEDGSVFIRVERTGSRVRISLTDDGPGIAPEYLDRIFDKFHQAPGGRRASGAGLGLAFCKSAVEAHLGEIGVQSLLGQGCTFWFTLPCGEPGQGR